jgi:hypothetical protein
MRKLLLGAVIAGLLLMCGCSIANAADKAWYDDWVGKIEGKAGFICITNEANKVIENGNEVEWDQCVGVEVLKWKKLNFDAGVSRAGVVYGDATIDLLQLQNIFNFPGAQYLTLSVGVYAGKDVDAIDGLKWGDDWVSGIMINLIDIDADTEKN